MSLPPLERLQELRKFGGFFPLLERSQIRLQGKDRERYLNGQVTIDIPRLPQSLARSALLLTAKGKLCAPLWIWKEKDSLVVETEPSLEEDTLARLDRYIVADDVTLEVCKESAPVFHVFGSPAPPGTLSIARLGMPGFDTSIPPEGLPEITPEEIEALRITQCLPKWGKELEPDTLPQEAGLDRTSVDFDKGCYVGQEVVSRLKSVGRVNKHLFAFTGTLESASRAPLPLHPTDSPEHPAGVLTSWCHDFELAQTVGLGYLNRQFEDFDSFVATGADGKILGKFEKRPILT